MNIKKIVAATIFYIFFFMGTNTQSQKLCSNKKTFNHTKIPAEASHQLLNEIGFNKLKEKKYYKAENLFLKAIIKNPTVKYYYNNLSAVYMNQGRYDEARKNLKIAILLDPNYVKALSNMAIACFCRFNFIEAYKYYLKAKKADREYTDERFEIKKARKKIKELQKKTAENNKLKKILQQIDLL